MFTAVVEAPRPERVTAILTVGAGNDREEFGPQPNNSRIERFIPRSLLLLRFAGVSS